MSENSGRTIRVRANLPDDDIFRCQNVMTWQRCRLTINQIIQLKKKPVCILEESESLQVQSSNPYDVQLDRSRPRKLV